jgi:hypothetical protein
MLAVSGLAMDQREVEAEFEQRVEQRRETGGQSHDPEIRRDQKTGEDHGADQTDAAHRETLQDHPRGAGCDPARQAGRRGGWGGSFFGNGHRRQMKFRTGAGVNGTARGNRRL